MNTFFSHYKVTEILQQVSKYNVAIEALIVKYGKRYKRNKTVKYRNTGIDILLESLEAKTSYDLCECTSGKGCHKQKN